MLDWRRRDDAWPGSFAEFHQFSVSTAGADVGFSGQSVSRANAGSGKVSTQRDASFAVRETRFGRSFQTFYIRGNASLRCIVAQVKAGKNAAVNGSHVLPLASSPLRHAIRRPQIKAMPIWYRRPISVI